MNLPYSRFSPPRFLDGEVHVWTVPLEASDHHLNQSLSWLSSEEQERASKFRFDSHRRDFVISHGVLRLLLGDVLQEHPGHIVFSLGPHGKPTIQYPGSPISFNMAHSTDVGAYVFVRGCPVGVDIERIRPMPDLENIATRFFSKGEVADLLTLGESERLGGFYTCWTRKEAYVKAIGDGLSIDLARFRMSLLPNAPAQLLSVDGDEDKAEQWTVHHLDSGPDCLGAVAYPDSPRPLRFHRSESVDQLFTQRVWDR